MPKKVDRIAHVQTLSPTAAVPPPPEPRLVEHVIHGQRVLVKVYPPTSDPSWSDWIQYRIRTPRDPFGIEDYARD